VIDLSARLFVPIFEPHVDEFGGIAIERIVSISMTVPAKAMLSAERARLRSSARRNHTRD
jgi:hypothetical protein